MSRKRRDKQDMELMRDEVNFWLLQTNNNPHEAYNQYIKDHLLRGKILPYYIKGIKDFINVSKDKKYNTVLQVEEKKEIKKTMDEQKQELINNISEDYYKEKIMPIYKQLSESKKNTRMAVVGLWYAITEKDIKLIDNIELGYIQEFIRENNLIPA